MESLAQLFGSATRVKLMRLFLFNPETSFALGECARKVKAESGETRKEMTLLINSGLVKKKSVVREIHSKKGPVKKVNELGYALNQKFLYLQPLKNLLVTVSLHADETLVKKLSPVGKIKLLMASGVFLREWDTRVDILIVGDELNMARLDTIMKNLESEVGKELTYSAFDTEEFEYRMGIHDRLVRDIIEAPHTTLIDKLGLEAQ
jgi:hypothetical protein